MSLRTNAVTSLTAQQHLVGTLPSRLQPETRFFISDRLASRAAVKGIVSATGSHPREFKQRLTGDLFLLNLSCRKPCGMLPRYRCHAKRVVDVNHGVPWGLVAHTTSRKWRQQKGRVEQNYEPCLVSNKPKHHHMPIRC